MSVSDIILELDCVFSVIIEKFSVNGEKLSVIVIWAKKLSVIVIWAKKLSVKRDRVPPLDTLIK